jgi:hypothetical protein
MSRRGFLKAASSIAMLTGISGLANSCTPRSFVGGMLWPEAPFDGIVPDQTFAYADVVPPAPDVISEDMLGFFTVDEANAVEALTTTIMPGTPEDPGAREAGVVTFIDTYLSRSDFAWSEPTYQNPPFAETFEGPQPPQSSSPYQRIWVRKDQIDCYGFQSRLTPGEIYRGGIVSLNQHSMNRFGARFADLDPQQQETIVSALADGNIDTFSEPSAGLFLR